MSAYNLGNRKDATVIGGEFYFIDQGEKNIFLGHDMINLGQQNWVVAL
jgi:hypothetical protein